MNKLLKAMAAIVLAASIVPVYASEEATSALTEQEITDRQKEDAANTKLALASAGTILGAVGGLMTGVATGSALTGGAMFAVPAATYCGLRYAYKKSFDAAAYKRICDTEDKEFLYTMMPFGILITLTAGAAACAGLVTIPAVVVGTPVSAMAAKLGIAKEGAAFIGAGIMAAIQAVFKTRADNIQNGHEEYQKITWTETLYKYGAHFGWAAASAAVVTGAALGSAGMITI